MQTSWAALILTFGFFVTSVAMELFCLRVIDRTPELKKSSIMSCVVQGLLLVAAIALRFCFENPEGQSSVFIYLTLSALAFLAHSESVKATVVTVVAYRQ